MLKFGDRARQTTTTTGTGTISLDGAAPAGWFSFAESGLVTGRTCHYLVELPNGQDFALIEGTLTIGSPSTLTRSRVIRSKIGGVAGTANPSLTGTSTVTCVWTAEDADNANPVLGTPSISAGTLVIDLDKNAESAHRISLNQNVSAGGISFVNPPSGYVKVYIEFIQATPSGTKYDVPITAWTGGPGTVTFDTDYAVYQDATPTVVWLTSTDGMATARARMNTELIAYLKATDIDTLAELNSLIADADLVSTTHAHTGGLGAQIAYSSLSGLPTLGGAAALNVGTTAGTVAAGNDSRLSDQRSPTAHANSHASGGGDALSGNLNATARLNVLKSASVIGTRRGINLIEGANVTLTVSDDSANERINVTVAASGGGGGGTLLPSVNVDCGSFTAGTAGIDCGSFA